MQDHSFWYCYDRATYINLVQWNMLLQGLIVVSLWCLLPQLIFPHKASQACVTSMHHLGFAQPVFTSEHHAQGTGAWKHEKRSQGGTCCAKDCWHCGRRRDQKSISHKAEDLKAFWQQANRSFTDCGTASVREAPRATSAPEALAFKRMQRLKKVSREAREQHEGQVQDSILWDTLAQHASHSEVTQRLAT